MYQALLHATKYSLNQMKERICGRRNAPKQILKPFFEVNVHLEGNESVLKPSLEEVQSAINRAASHVLKSTKKVQNWNQKDQPEDEREPFYDWIAKDKEIVKVILLLTGSIQGTKNKVNEFLSSFEQYSWLWTKRADEALKLFNKNNPQLEDYEAKLNEFNDIMQRVTDIEGSNQIGALSLKTENVKAGLKSWIDSWKDAFSRDLHKKAKNSLESLTDEVKQIKLKIDKPVKDIDSLGGVMHALEEIRKKQSDIDLQFKPINEMYNLIDSYFSNIMDKDEIDSKTAMQNNWETLVVRAEVTRNELQGQQADFKMNLIKGIKSLVIDVKEFRHNFETKGPTVAGLEPREALNRLRMFSDEYSIRKRKYDSYFSGEILFGLPHTQYPLLVKTASEIELLDKLYSLYSKVKDTIAKWREIPWSEIQNEIEKMIETIDQFSRDCTKLPGSLKSWEAYKELKQEIDDMTEILPLVTALAKPSIRNRHWDDVIELVKEEIPYQSENFTLQQLFKCPLLQFREEIEEITESADKQLKLEKTLKEEIIAYWEEAELQIKTWKGVDQPCTLGGNILDIQEKLEEHLNQLNQMNAMKYVTPFKTEVTDRIALLSDVADVIEKWLKVQTLWTNLVSVFTSGDIAKNLPTEAKLFKTIDKIWLKNMERAFETKNVIQCCQNELLKSSLGQMQIDLEKCQKQLDSYLEQKRSIFPRFYFCSNADLLKILSQGSDPNAVQDDFEKLFDAINRVTFDEQDRRLITVIHQQFAGDEEDITLDEGVKAEGNIEDWLAKLEKEMQKSMKKICQSAAQDCFSMPLREFIDSYPSQVSLLGIQFLWTTRLQEALSKGKKVDKQSDLDKKKKDNDNIMKELTAMCLDESIKSKLIRTKVETLVTIQVYQRDKFDEIIMLVKNDKIKDENDFDWLKNTRCYWKVEEATVAVSVTDVEFVYQYEFLGAKERLCITALTDRCYVTLSQALGMMYGGAPAGPAGTGKTETVKDLGRTLGIFVVVTNCSDEHKFRDMAKIFKGVC
jgi:dynein heavy chain